MPRPLLAFSQSDYLIQVVDTNSNSEWQTVQVQISWLLQKPTDLDLHCLQRQGISGFSRTRVNKFDNTLSASLQIQPINYSVDNRSRGHLNTRVKFSADNIFRYFSYFSQKKRL